MKQQIDIGKKAEESLDSLEGIRRATPRPYFYARLKARLTRENGWVSGVAGFISRPAFALTMIVIVLFVNTWMVFKNDIEQTPAKNTTAATDFPDDYDLTVTTLYNYDTP